MAGDTRYCLITGCGKGGIGAALAFEFVEKGYHVLATVLPSEPRAHLENNDSITIYHLDVTSEPSIQALHASVSLLTKGQLSILVNNAGITYTIPAVDTELPLARKLFDVNFFGPVAMTHHFHRLLIASSGTIVNISSIAGVSPYVYGGVYNASKAALVHFMDTLRVEMAPFGIRVVNVISGEVGTGILSRERGCQLNAKSVFGDTHGEAFKAHVNRVVENASKPEDYAKAVVAEVTKRHPKRWFWWGSSTTVVWFLDTFFGKWVWEMVLGRMFGLEKIAEARKRI